MVPAGEQQWQPRLFYARFNWLNIWKQEIDLVEITMLKVLWRFDNQVRESVTIARTIGGRNVIKSLNSAESNSILKKIGRNRCLI